jgi:hypothetical protein
MAVLVWPRRSNRHERPAVRLALPIVRLSRIATVASWLYRDLAMLSTLARQRNLGRPSEARHLRVNRVDCGPLTGHDRQEGTGQQSRGGAAATDRLDCHNESATRPSSAQFLHKNQFWSNAR